MPAYPCTHMTYQVAVRDAGACSGGCLRGVHVSRVVRRLAGRVGCGGTSSQRLMVGRRAHGLGWVGWWVLRRVWCCRHPWLGGHGVVALVGRSRVAGWHTWGLRVRGVHHSGGRGGGHNRTWSAAHLVQAAAGAGEADDNGDNREHKDGQANSYSRPEPAKEPVMTRGLCPCPGPAVHSPFPGGTPLAGRLGNTNSNFWVSSLNLFQPQFPQA